MLEHINSLDIQNHVLLAQKLNEMIDQINESIFVLSIPLNTIKSLLELKDVVISQKDQTIVEKDDIIKTQGAEIKKIKPVIE